MTTRRALSPEIATGHLVLHTIDGQGSHMIDFTDYPLSIGRLLHIQPGQVHRPRETDRDNTAVLLISAEICPLESLAGFTPRPDTELGPLHEAAANIFRDVQRQFARPNPEPSALIAAAQRLVDTMTTTADRDSIGYSEQADLVRRFRIAVEAGYPAERRVSAYARAIGSSPRTLGRAVAAVTGVRPKDLIDDRVALQAKRELAITADSIATVGARLGFSEPSNFSKFFLRRAGATPAAFRAQLQ